MSSKKKAVEKEKMQKLTFLIALWLILLVFFLFSSLNTKLTKHLKQDRCWITTHILSLCFTSFILQCDTHRGVQSTSTDSARMEDGMINSSTDVKCICGALVRLLPFSVTLSHFSFAYVFLCVLCLLWDCVGLFNISLHWGQDRRNGSMNAQMRQKQRQNRAQCHFGRVSWKRFSLRRPYKLCARCLRTLSQPARDSHKETSVYPVVQSHSISQRTVPWFLSFARKLFSSLRNACECWIVFFIPKPVAVICEMWKRFSIYRLVRRVVARKNERTQQQKHDRNEFYQFDYSQVKRARYLVQVTFDKTKFWFFCSSPPYSLTHFTWLIEAFL